ncbi:hypothetical protein [Polynucleobacter sp. UK-Kesae-W10]|uniref:hypothetical protein n=1 Tax=Polynucleobacter sp. UK-Kesae-W10 TaxID=1819738 RepID=UPI001C0D68AF|nr:hypothetical protein [Polynucleobacter sp. UK-Kesae-W10]MBU3577509.1 hypothetical protein [Polynucleobacter sp. UK-Kesae-W10]
MKGLLDLDGENRAVRMFLALYGGACGVTIGKMRKHLEMAGFNGDAWPAWAALAHDDVHLTKMGAQDWLRHLFDLERNIDTSEKRVHISDKNVHITPVAEMPPTFRAYIRKGLADGTLQIIGAVNAS